jgi:hypothetical protein
MANAVGGEAAEFEIGGPLAGVKLPPMPTQHGEEPGYPGCVPELMAQGETIEDMGNRYCEWGPQGQAREWELYDGAVEHWRAYMMKYLPMRSFFDRQSLVKNWIAPNIPGTSRSDVAEFAEPVYWVPRHAAPQATGRFREPVPVVRLKPGTPMLKLDLGTLDRGVYAVRVIGAVETKTLRTMRLPLLVRMRVNDGPAGETTEYLRRAGYCDQFYSVAEIYFHAPVRRSYRAELHLDSQSQVDLFVANVTLDDALAGVARQAIKSKTTIESAQPAARAALANRKQQGATITPPLDKQQRFEVDQAIWNQFPLLNTQGSSIQPGGTGYGAVPGVSAGTEQLDGKQIEDQFGKWEAPPLTGDITVGDGADAKSVPAHDLFAVNRKLGLVYTVNDLRQHRPLPDPYPVKDTGPGVITLAAGDEGKGTAWTPIGRQVHGRRRDYYNQVGRLLTQYKQRGDYDLAHESALRLIRFAYDFPTFDPSDSIDNCIRDPGRYGRDLSCRRRQTMAAFLPHYPLYVKPYLFWYDELFDFIKGNQVLAESVGRFVPWVKTPNDVIRLIDVYLVQTTAKRIMRYHYHTDVADLANLAAIVGNRQVTAPWMEWLFSRTFVYPLPVAGIQDVMISGCNREGTEFVGSTYYAQGEGAARVARSLDLYLLAGGNPDYDLSDSSRYPKPVSHAYWRLENVVAGADFLRVGDVCGPDKVPGHTLRDLEFARSAWKWTKDPAFALILRHYLGQADETDQQWKEIEQAANQQPRAPWLENRSRVLPYWAGVLEAGTEHDDYRFRRAAYVRLGFGAGHHHNDTLDLQVFAHGLPMTIDGGQRPGYSKPADRTTSVHNVVQVDGLPAYRHSWARTLADTPGARYLSADAAPAPNISLMRRQVALIDVDAGEGSQELPPEQQLPGSNLPSDIVTPNCYIFDVFRVDGGQRHMYCFHGPLNDDFQWNATRVGKPAPGSDEAAYLARYNRMPESTFTGDAPATLEATWQMAIEVDGPGGGEKEMLRKNYHPDTPRKFTRLHLLGTAGLRAMRAECVCRQWGYHYTNLMVREPPASGPTHRAYVALIEPYVGRPVITLKRELKITNNEHDARRAVAVEVKTATGNTDICFADARPDRVRELPDAKMRVAGEFACYGTDEAGLRQATLVGGRILETPLVRIQPAMAERRGNVTRVDYLARKLWIDQPWPRRTTESVFESGLPDHWTTYTAVRVEPAGGGSCLTLKRGADFFRSRVTQVVPDRRQVHCTLKPLLEFVDHNRHGWVASDDQQSTFWRASYLGAGSFELHGPPVDEQSFGAAGVLRLWEYGAGDRVRQSTSVSLTRINKETFELTTDVNVAVSLPGSRVEISTDSKTFRPAAATQTDGWITLQVPPRDEPLMVRLAR